MILVGRDDRYGFRHALLREVIYDDLLPGERAELHLKLARALEATLSEDDHLAIRAAAVAHHFNAAGDQPQALRSAVAAARAVERGGTPGAAAALLDRALALWPRVAEPEALAGVEHVTLLARAARAHGLERRRGATRSPSTTRRSTRSTRRPSRTSSPACSPKSPRCAGRWDRPRRRATTWSGRSPCCPSPNRPRSGR